jgi:putative NADPH-quinone reductase
VRVFIVHAHPEPASFNGALTREAVAALTAAGHQVELSDLSAMRFDPVSDRRNFATVHDAGAGIDSNGTWSGCWRSTAPPPSRIPGSTPTTSVGC